MRKQEIYFEMFGFVAPISRREARGGRWEWICTTEGDDYCLYDIVRNKETDEYRCVVL